MDGVRTQIGALFPEPAASTVVRPQLERIGGVSFWDSLEAVRAAVHDGLDVLVSTLCGPSRIGWVPDLVALARERPSLRVLITFDRTQEAIEEVVVHARSAAGILYVPWSRQDLKLLLDWAAATRSPPTCSPPGPSATEFLTRALLVPGLSDLPRRFLGVCVAWPCGLSVPEAAALGGAKERTLEQQLKRAGLRPPEFWLRAGEAWTAAWWVGPQRRTLGWTARVLRFDSAKRVAWALKHYVRAPAKGLRLPGEYPRRLERFASATLRRAVASDRLRYRAPAHVLRDDQRHEQGLVNARTGSLYVLSPVEGFVWNALAAGASEADLLRVLEQERLLPPEQLPELARAIIDRLVSEGLLEPDSGAFSGSTDFRHATSPD